MTCAEKVFDCALAFVAGAILMLALIGLPGCAAAPEAAPEPDPALSAALAALGAPAGSGAPSLRWRESSPACAGVAFMEGGRCVRGVTVGDRVEVATWPGAAPSQTSLAHEGLHWYLGTQGVDSKCHEGDFYARVERANAELWRAGL